MNKIATDTKQKLIDTALDLIWQSSYGSVSVDDICKAAGVKKGSFYHFFPSKVDLAAAAMEHSFHCKKAIFDAIFSPTIPALRRFDLLVDHVYAMQKEAAEKYGHVCGCPCASLGSEMAVQESEIREKFEEFARQQALYYENALRDLIVDGLIPVTTDVKVKAQELFAFILGQLMMARIQNDLVPLQRDLKAGLIRTIGIQAPHSDAA